MTHIELSQFQRQLCLSDAVLCHLLRENKLGLELDPSRGLLVCISDTTIQQVIDAIRTRAASLPAPAQELLTEAIATAVRKVFDQASDSALAIVLAEQKIE